ncbi:MAG: ribonuclease III [Patescibacteria group bacterium]|nr:ribonuclease III [Patescibacteria group bacterium]
MSEKIHQLAKKIKIEFKDINLLQTAVTHRSYLNEHRHENLEHNERLEFLGDAVLELIVTEYLFNQFEKKPEGELTSLRAALVKGDNLSKIGRELSIDDHLLLSRGESKSQSRSKNYIMANALEAIIGAIYLDRGYDACKKFITKHIIKELPGIINDKLYRDPKSLFQEKIQEKAGVTPSYKLLSQSGPDHDKQFRVGAFIGSEMVSQGQGLSKQEAQQKAAENYLEKDN